MSAANIRRALLSTPDSEAALTFRQQADKFEEELLGMSRIPEDYLQLFVEIISGSEFTTRPGVWNFVVRMLPARGKLTRDQLERIVKGFEVGYGQYKEERLRLLAGDFVAIACAPARAITALRTMAEKAASKEAKTSIKIGLETVMGALPPESADHRLCQELMSALG